MKKNLNTYKDFCTGCGLCSSVKKTEFQLDENGFPQPLLNENDIEFLDSICPVSGKLWEEQGNGIWGDFKQIFLGWSKDQGIRQQASSGGVITSLCIYLLKRNIVDGIIQTRKSNLIPYETETVICRSEEDILKCMGSRYSISSPLMNIRELLNTNEKYCFVGKPCDIYALKSYFKIDSVLSNLIPVTISFFCAGMPSVNAQLKLLECLNSSKEQCADLRYRGDGWPGYTTAINQDGSTKNLSYAESWGGILGRDVRKSCRFCIDGIGAFADIACCDAWHLKDNKPDFTESQGQNVVFARSEIGEKILLNALSDGAIFLEDYRGKLRELDYIQSYQHERRATMQAMLLALKICGHTVPLYSVKTLSSFAKSTSLKKKLSRFAGTIKRIIKGKI